MINTVLPAHLGGAPARCAGRGERAGVTASGLCRRLRQALVAPQDSAPAPRLSSCVARPVWPCAALCGLQAAGGWLGAPALSILIQGLSGR